MFCTKCGTELREQDNFCFNCGALTGRAHSNVRPIPALSRPVDHRMIAGVCAGFARYMGVDVALIRILWVVVSFCGVGLVAYIVAWIVMPRDPVTAVASVPVAN